MSADQPDTMLAGMPAGQEAREQELADRVLASFAHAGDDRLKEVMQALTRHLLTGEHIAVPASCRSPPSATGHSRLVGHPRIIRRRRTQLTQLSSAPAPAWNTATRRAGDLYWPVYHASFR